MSITDINFSLEGIPIPYARPRVTRNGTYDIHAKEKKLIKNILFHAFPKFPLFTEGSLGAELIFYLPIPSSVSNKKKEEMSSHKILPTKRPDIDNLVKFILDCATGLLFKDDNQITDLTATKRYHKFPSTTITIKKINPILML